VQQRCPQGVSRGAAPGRKENVQKHIQKEKKEKKRKKEKKAPKERKREKKDKKPTAGESDRT